MGETGVAGIYKQKALAWLGFVSTHIKHMEIRLKLGFISHDQPLANGRCFLGLKPSEKATPEKKKNNNNNNSADEAGRILGLVLRCMLWKPLEESLKTMDN